MNNIKNGIESMDIITLYSVYKQLENISSDEQQAKFIKKVIKAIADEIEKLHKENEDIMKKIDNLERTIKNGIK